MAHMGYSLADTDDDKSKVEIYGAIYRQYKNGAEV